MSITVHTTHFNARPDCGDRLEKEAHVYELLDRLGISYEGVDHDTANTIEDCEAVEQELGVKICKNLFLCNRQKTAFYLLVLPGGKSLQTKELSKQIPTSRLSFASGEDMERLLNVTPGSATIMGLIFDPENRVQLLVDEEIWKVLVCLSSLREYIQYQTEDRGMCSGNIWKAVHHDYIKVTLSDGKK